MLTTMMVILGASDGQHPAVELALDWAEARSALLVGLGIVDESAESPREAVPLGAAAFKAELDAARLAAAVARVEATLSAFSLRCAERQVASKVLERIGWPANEIAEEAQRFDLLIVPARVGTSASTALGPSLAEILGVSPRPVVAVPSLIQPGEAVLVAYDGSLQAARTLQLFAGSGLGVGKPIHILSLNRDRVAAAKVGDRAVEFLAAHDLRAQLRAEALSTAAAEKILQVSTELGAGLLVMGAYGQPRWREFLLGSVTQHVLAGATVPMFMSH